MGVKEKHKVDAANIKHAILNAKGFNIHPRTRQQPQKHDEPEGESIRNSEIAAVLRNSTHDERYPGHVAIHSRFEACITICENACPCNKARQSNSLTNVSATVHKTRTYTREMPPGDHTDSGTVTGSKRMKVRNV